MTYPTYAEWKAAQRIFPGSPEAYYAEAAWNAAIAAAQVQLIKSGNGLLAEEIEKVTTTYAPAAR